jgi:ferredoxin
MAVGEMRYLAGVTTLAADPEACVGCGACLEVCPHQILALEDGRITVTDRDACMECGACATNCPTGAISVQAGVGCAAAIIGSAFRRPGGGACC